MFSYGVLSSPLLIRGVRRSRRPPVAVERKAREVAPAFHIFHPEAFMAALRACNHEVVLADLPALLGAARLYLALVRAEKTRRTSRRANAHRLSVFRLVVLHIKSGVFLL